MDIKLKKLLLATSLTLLIPLGAGCQKETNRLSGSVGKLYDLSFVKTRARLYSSEFVVEYVREDGQVPVRVVVDRSEELSDIARGKYNLEKRGDLIGRIDDRRLPSMKSGKVKLKAYKGRSGTPVEGEFDGQLRSGDTTFTIRGVFETTLQVVDGSLGYGTHDVGSMTDGVTIDGGDVGDR